MGTWDTSPRSHLQMHPTHDLWERDHVAMHMHRYVVSDHDQTCNTTHAKKNQFNRGKMWKFIDSITINRYNLNISINSMVLLSTYKPIQSTHVNMSNDSINSIHCWFFWENLRFRWPFLSIFESTELIQSYQSLKVNLNRLLYENELTQSSINSLGKGTESI